MKTFKEHSEIKEFLDDRDDLGRTLAKSADPTILVQEFIYDVLKITWNITKILVKIMVKGGQGLYYGTKWSISGLYGRYSKLARATRKAEKAMKKAKSAEDLRTAKVHYIDARLRLETERKMIDELSKEEKAIYKADIAKITKSFDKISDTIKQIEKNPDMKIKDRRLK
jgi:thymidylate synthase